MIVIYGIPTDSDTSNKLPAAEISSFAEEFITKIATITPDTFVVFVSYKPDKRTKFYKYLEKNATVKLFEKPAPWQLKQQVLQWTP